MAALDLHDTEQHHEGPSSIGSSRLCLHDSASLAEGSNSLKVLSKKLKDMVQLYVLKRENVSRLETFLFTLKSRRLRNLSSSLDFLGTGGVDSLLELSRSIVKDSEKESSLLNLVWGTIGNLCSFDEKIQRKVTVSAIPDICETLCKCSYPKVLNTVCRTIGNISSTLVLSNAYQPDMFVKEITRIIVTCKDSGCLQSALRAIQKLSNAGTLNKELRLAKTIPAIINILLMKDKDVAVAALKSLEGLSCPNGNGNCDLLSELWSPDITPLRKLVETVPNGDGLMDNMVIILLCRCVQHVDGKAAVSRAGGIDLMVKYFMGYSKNSDLYLMILNSLCLCCRDVHGRQKIRDLNGLQLLLDLIRDDSVASFHENILAGLICYYFDEHTLRHMVNKLNLMKSLVHHLNCFTSKLVPDELPAAMSNSAVTTTDDSSVVDSRLDTNTAPSSLCSSTPDDNPPDTESDCSSSVLSSTFTVSTQPSTSPSPPTTQSTTNDTTSINFSDEFLNSCLSGPYNLQSPTTKQVLPLDIDTSDLMPVNYIDSVLDSPSLSYSNMTTVTSSNSSTSSSIQLLGSDSGDCVEGKVLLLVSRVSHLHDCQPILATSEIFTAILQYFFASNGHNRSQIFKVLSKIFKNPLCFQDCLINHAPSLLFMHFKTNELHSCSSSLPSTGHTIMCRELFDMLSHVAGLPFGLGVIAHMLLTGDDKQVTAGTLALALLEKSPIVCHRMLTTDSYIGLHKLICLSQGIGITSEGASQIEDDNLIESAMVILLSLAHNFYTNPPRKRQYPSIAEDNYSYYSPMVNKKPKQYHNQSIASTEAIPMEPSMMNDGSTSPSLCFYKDTDHSPFDLLISVDNGCGESCVFPVHRSVFVESSDVFTVMLEGSYQESQSNEVHLNNLEPSVFLSIVHFVYGCQLPCIDVSTSCVDSIGCPIAHSLIQDIVRPLNTSVDYSYHWLLLLEHANRFNIPTLIYRCEENLKLLVLESNLVPMFLYSIIMNNRPIARHCVLQLISLRHVQNQCKIMKELLNSGDAQSFIEILQEFFHVY